MENFIQIQTYIVEFAKSKGACSAELNRAKKATTVNELLQVVKDNIGWTIENNLYDAVKMEQHFGKDLMVEFGLWNSGEGNTGFSNTGYSNTGYRNTGYRNTGDRNTGDRNTGDRNTGDSNTGDRNTGDSNTGDSNTGYSNTGYSNTGDWNTGHWNTGHWNTGHWNTGYSNTGYRNTGYSNTGYSNTGDRNTGDRNTGHWNTGDRNTGHWNTGHWNTGHWNTGYSNTGYSNTGDRNTGAFCTGENKIKLFNKESDWTHKQFIESRVYQLLCQVDTKLWVYENAMTDEEKEKFPSYKTAEGYLKDIPFKEAFGNRWHNWSEDNRSAFTSLPNFDASIFETITGVKV